MLATGPPGSSPSIGIFKDSSCSRGRRSLVGCSPWGRQEVDTTERLHFHFSLSCIGEGNGNPLQCSCLENPRGGGAWWAAIYGVAESWTQLKRLSSSSSSSSSQWPPKPYTETDFVIRKKNFFPFCFFGHTMWLAES